MHNWLPDIMVTQSYKRDFVSSFPTLTVFPLAVICVHLQVANTTITYKHTNPYPQLEGL